ncbi:MAG: glycosyltransferase [Candidatus Brocadiae bacterium]|nr:glycosyltransferase [Candidatus Brocadiia bacterium]
MKKLLFITKFIPAPDFSGGAKRSLAWIRFLSKYFDITIVGFWNKIYGYSRINQLDQYAERIEGVTFVRTKASLMQMYITCLCQNTSLILTQYQSIELKSKIQTLLGQNTYDCIFCSELASVQYVPEDCFIPIVFDDHNIEYELTERNAKHSSHILKWFYKREAKMIKKFEHEAWKNASMVSFVSQRDESICQSAISGIYSCVVENSYDDEGILITDEWYDEPTLLFIGNVSWKPNRTGLKHFLTAIYPQLKQKIKLLKLYIVGSGMTIDVQKLCKDDSILIKENIEENEKRKIISKSWLCIVPVYWGSGTRIKILEYWANGKCVVSTTIGAEGLNASPGIVIADDDDDFIKAIEDALSDKKWLHLAGLENRYVFERKYKESRVYESSLYRTIAAQCFGEDSNTEYIKNI